MSEMNLLVESNVERSEIYIKDYLVDKGVVEEFWIALDRRNPVPGEWWCYFRYKKDAPTHPWESKSNYNQGIRLKKGAKVCGVIRTLKSEYNDWITRRKAKRDFNDGLRSAFSSRAYIHNVEVHREGLFATWDENDNGNGWYYVQAKFQYQQQWTLYQKSYKKEDLSLGAAIRNIDDAYLKWMVNIEVYESHLIEELCR